MIGWPGRDRRGAKDNPEMEPLYGRFKTEGHSLFLEAQSFPS
jgi:hypothetical protein